jgi:DNA repair protein SbcD/Mre11
MSYSRRIAEARNDLELCCGFLDHVRSRDANDAERALLRDTLAGAAAAEVSA